MLEMTACLEDIPTHYYGVCFIAISGKEEGKLGAENLLK